jgi:hypothetical protein
MGRSVNYLNRATSISFSNHEFGYEYPYNDEADEYDKTGDKVYNECIADMHWDDFVYNLKEALEKYYPSFEFNAKGFEWEDREVKIIARNKLAIIGLSEYCGLISLSIRPVEAEWYQDRHFNALGEQFASQVNLDKVLGYANGDESLLRKVGSFSNGEGILRRAT